MWQFKPKKNYGDKYCTFTGITEIAVCMMFDIDLSLRIISHFVEDTQWRDFSANQKWKRAEAAAEWEREFQGYFQKPVPLWSNL